MTGAGVDKVKGDCNSVKLEVTGKVDPFKVKEMVERETKKKVKLILPSAETEGDKDQNKDTEAKLKKQTKTVHENDIVNKKTEEVIKLELSLAKLVCKVSHYLIYPIHAFCHLLFFHINSSSLDYLIYFYGNC